MIKSNFKIFVLILLVFLTGCGANRKKLTTCELASMIHIPAGVDTLLAIKADSLANLFFVNFANRTNSTSYLKKSEKLFCMADSLWNSYGSVLDSNIVTTFRDSNIVTDIYSECYSLLNQEDNKQQKFPNFKKVKSLTYNLCRNANNYAEKAKLTDPFNLDVRLHLIQILRKMGQLSGKKKYYKKAVTELNELEACDKSSDYIYLLLAESYYSLTDWEKAFQNFHQAQNVLESNAIFRNFPPKLDTTQLVYYLKQQGDTKAKIYDAISALKLLTEAKKISHSLEQKKLIQNYIDWINWDDGNIRAVEKRDANYDLFSQKKYKNANKGFKKLIKILRTQRTRNQINWKIATTDFKILNKKNDGIKRLFKVITDIPPENLSDSASVVYLNDYGAMCYSLGMDYLSKKKYKIAYAYFKQAAKTNWQKRGDSYFQLAQLSQSDPDETIKNCKKVLTYENSLTSQILNKTYELLVNAYKRNGNFMLARKYYNKLNFGISLNSY